MLPHLCRKSKGSMAGQKTLAAYFQSGAAAAEATGQLPNGNAATAEATEGDEDPAEGADDQPATKKRGRSGMACVSWLPDCVRVW